MTRYCTRIKVVVQWLESTLPSTMSSNDAMSVDECSETEDILESLDSKVK